MTEGKRRKLGLLAAALLIIAAGSPGRVSAESGARWTVQVSTVDPGKTALPRGLQFAIYESLVHDLSVSTRFKDVLREGDRRADHAVDLLVLHSTVDKYTPGNETLRAVTTVAGWTKVTVHAHVSRADGTVILDRDVTGNVRLFGSNMRVAQNVAHAMTRILEKCPLPATRSRP